MKIDIEEIVKSDYTLEDVLVLLEIEYARRGKFFPYSSVRKEHYISLYKKGVLTTTANGYNISVSGYQELRKIIGEKPLELRKAAAVSNFEEFWNTFPVSDKHGQWLRTRTLKSNKSKCLELYNLAIKNGVAHQDMIDAIKWEMKDRKATSTTRNNMSYMKASSTWLSQKEYEVIKEAMGDDTGADESDNWSESVV